jgi:hypothetical protein
MSFFFLIARVVRAAYKGLRAAAGILILTHGVFRWLKNSDQRAARRAAAA